LTQYTKIPPEVAATLPRSTFDEGPRVDAALVQPVIDLMVRYGSLKPFAAADVIWSP
jgi:hypothetical protein